MISVIPATVKEIQLVSLVSRVIESLNQKPIEVIAGFIVDKWDCHKGTIEVDTSIEGVSAIEVVAEINTWNTQEEIRDARVTVIDEDGNELKFSKVDQQRINSEASNQLALIR
jgi:hypothetical protein